MLLKERDILQIDHHQTFDVDPRSSRGFSGVSTDSRTAGRDAIFVPLRGATFDGHDFLTQAVERGARLVLVERSWAERNMPLMMSLPVGRVIVNDTTAALGELARLCRRKVRIPVVAVAGSNGKTTTKDMIARVLGERFTVLSTEGNLNNRIGVPQTLFRLQSNHECAVVEIGTNHFGELTSLCDILEPTHGLITNIGSEHLEFFRNRAGVARAEGELFEWLRIHRGSKARIFLNRDDATVTRLSRGLTPAATYGTTGRNLTVQGAFGGTTPLGTPVLQIHPKGTKSFDVRLRIPGRHNALNALAAAAVGIAFNVPVGRITRALEEFTPSSKRSEMLDVNGVLILNDTYNSNPDSVAAALHTLASLGVPGKKIVVLADMLELGAAAEQAHRRVGSLVGASGADYLLTYGPLSRLTHETASAPFKAHYDQKNILAEYLAELVTAGDAVLIKGSRGMKMEDVVTFLTTRLQPSVTALRSVSN